MPAAGCYFLLRYSVIDKNCHGHINREEFHITPYYENSWWLGRYDASWKQHFVVFQPSCCQTPVVLNPHDWRLAVYQTRNVIPGQLGALWEWLVRHYSFSKSLSHKADFQWVSFPHNFHYHRPTVHRKCLQCTAVPLRFRPLVSIADACRGAPGAWPRFYP